MSTREPGNRGPHPEQSPEKHPAKKPDTVREPPQPGKDLPPGEQVVIHFSRIPGTAEKSNYKDFKLDGKGGVQLIYNDQMLISTFIAKIENLEIEINGKIKKIKDGVELASVNNSALSELFTEIRDYLFPENEIISEGESGA